jgi:hypothetical protein
MSRAGIYLHEMATKAFMIWALGTGARPEAVTELHSQQIDFRHGPIHLNPPEREQVAKKYRPVVRLPNVLGWAVSYEDLAVLLPAHGSTLDAHEGRVPPREVAAQARAQRRQGVCDTERYAFYSPDYLSGAVKALDGLIRSGLTPVWWTGEYYRSPALAPAEAHSWYPKDCCHDDDCLPVERVVRLAPTGGGAPQFLVTRRGTTLIPENFPVRESNDSRMHICVRANEYGRDDVMCLFMPPSM